MHENKAKQLATAIGTDCELILRTPDEEYPMKDGKLTFYICKDHACLPPTNDTELFNIHRSSVDL